MARIAKKINITIRDDLLERIDDYAGANAMTRSGLLALAATQYLDAIEAMPSVSKLLASLAAVAEGKLNGELTAEQAGEQLDGIKTTYETVFNRKIDAG